MKRCASVLVSNSVSSLFSSCNRFFSACGVHALYIENNGKKVLEAIKQYRPDIVILNALMPFFDASSIIHISHEMKFLSTKFIVLSDREDVELEKENIEVGASEYLKLPVEDTILFSKTLKLLSHTNWRTKKIGMRREKGNNMDPEILVTNIILSLGIPPHINGYGYLREAVLIYYNTNAKISITKNVYPVIAKRNKSTAMCVERSIRHAISVAWNMSIKNGKQKMCKIDNKKPTNAKFIALILNKLCLNMKPEATY